MRSKPRVWTTTTYDRLSRYYDTFMKFFFPLGEKGRARIAEKLTAGSVLDVACGTGTLLEMAQKKGLKCCGIDISKGILAQAKRKIPGTEFTLVSYYKIPYADGYFDIIYL